MRKSLKKEQVELLKFEKQLLGLGAGLGALSVGAAANADAKVGDVAAHTAKVQEAYLNLVETVQSAHSAIEASAIEAGVQLFQAKSQPKDEVLLQAARSILGLG